MEIMKKCLRSVYQIDGLYAFIKVTVEEAKQLVDAGSYIYISKEEYKRNNKFYNHLPSQVAYLEECTGTLIKHIDKDGNKSYESLHNINYVKNLGEQYPSSTKLGAGSMGSNQVRRRNKYAKKDNGKTSKFYVNYKLNQLKTKEDLLDFK
jgi:hypothetical protein